MKKFKIFNSHWSKFLATVIFVGCFLFFFVHIGLAQQQCSGTPTVGKFIHPSSVESGDPVQVIVTVAGCSGQTLQPIPFDGVLMIDMSNSMDDDPPQSDPDDLRLDAAKEFIDCVASETRLAIVTFSTDANLIQGLTTDRGDLRSEINGLYGDAAGSTNIHDAMEIAQQHLIDNGLEEREKFIILLTDGEDYSGHSDSEILDLAYIAKDHGIHYLTIALGSEADLFFLTTLAFITDGQCYPSLRASELSGLYDIICNYASHHAKTRDIVLKEELNSWIHVVPGSVVSDIESITDSQISSFVETGKITADIGALAYGEGRYLQFDVVTNCLTPDSEERSVDVSVDASYPSSKVTYIFGVDEGEVEVPERTFECLRPGDLRVTKEYDFQTSILNISLESRYVRGTENNVIRNIEVIENPSLFFQPNLSSVNPIFNYVFPSPETDVLAWKIPKLDPEEIKILSIELESRVCSNEYFPPIIVNAGKTTGGFPGWVSYVRPDGTSNIINLPFGGTSLPFVERCDGRADIYVQPAYSFEEYLSAPDFNRYSVLPENETPDIWIDSYEENGFWDGSENIGDFVRGASLREAGPDVPIRERIRVYGQGDLVYPRVKNYVMVRVRNTGSLPSEEISQGAVLTIYNQTSSQWDIFSTDDLPQVDDQQLVGLLIPPDMLRSDHITPYALPLDDVMRIIRSLDPDLARRITSNGRNTPEWRALAMQGEIIPDDIERLLLMLPDEDCPWWNPFCWFRSTVVELFQDFLSEYGDRMTWGKPSSLVKVEFTGPDSEKHTNNNLSTEIVIVSS